jgi:two-component system sensor histidine kinase TctE
VRQSGRLLTGYAALPVFDARAVAADGPVFRTATYNGVPVRQAAEARRVAGASAPVVISVAQTLDSRQAVRGSLMLSAGAMEGGLVLLVALFIWPAAMWSLRPVAGLQRSLTERATSRALDFTPVDAAHLPGELTPVVTAFNTVLAQLERSVEGVSRFTADASHQMRTPLTILKTHLSLLKRSRHARDQSSLKDAVDAVDRLQRLIEQLLALARADAVDDGPATAPGDLAQAAQNVVRRWQPRFRDAGHALAFRAAAEGVSVSLVEPLIEQALENLLDNALRYGGPNASVTITADEAFAVLLVCDDGPGLPPNVAKRAFDRFVRGADACGSGSGLGLSIVRALARRSGGEVAAAVEAGLFCVRLTLPVIGHRSAAARG